MSPRDHAPRCAGAGGSFWSHAPELTRGVFSARLSQHLRSPAAKGTSGLQLLREPESGVTVHSGTMEKEIVEGGTRSNEAALKNLTATWKTELGERLLQERQGSLQQLEAAQAREKASPQHQNPHGSGITSTDCPWPEGLGKTARWPLPAWQPGVPAESGARGSPFCSAPPCPERLPHSRTCRTRRPRRCCRLCYGSTYSARISKCL